MDTRNKVSQNCKKSICFLHKERSNFNKNLWHERDVLQSHGFSVTSVCISTESSKKTIYKSIIKIRNLVKVLRTLRTGQYDFYHSHEVSLMFIAWLVCLFKKAKYIKDYHELLLSANKAVEREPNAPQEVDAGIDVFYEQKEIWDRDISDRDIDRLEKTIASIPVGVKTILDVGCGSGNLINKIAANYQTTGLDISKEALTRVKAPTVLAPAYDIPFPDKSFDLVVSTEMLEHLPEEEYHRSLLEITRVAKNYVIFGVPNNEILQLSQCLCYNCRKSFHANYHLRSFNIDNLRGLLGSDFVLKDYVFCGTERLYYYKPLLAIKQRFGGGWIRSATSLCLYCGSDQRKCGDRERNAITWYCDTTNNNRKKEILSQKSHVVALYQKVHCA